MPTGQTATGCVDCCPGCLIGSDDFSANDGRPHAGWTNRPAIWGTTAGDEATNTGGVFSFPKPNTQKFNTAHPDGVGGLFHVRVKFKLHELTADDGAAAAVIVGYLSDTAYLVARVSKLGTFGNGCDVLDIAKFDAAGSNGFYTCLNPVCVVPIRGLTLDQWHTLDVCLIPNNYGAYGDGDTIRAHLTLADGTHWSGQGIAEGYTTGTFVGLANEYVNYGTGVGDNTRFGSVEFDDFKFNYFRETPDHASCPNCNGPCFIFDDNFPYADSADNVLGCFWTATESPATGIARIKTNRLECDNGSRIKCRLPHPTNKTSKIVTVSILWETGIIARVDLGTGYAQFDSTNRRIFLRDNAGTLLDSTAVNSLPAFDDALHEVEVCYGNGTLTGTFDGDDCASASSPDTDDPFVYLGSDGGTVHFDNFSFSKHADSSEPIDGSCDVCSCPVECIICLGGTGPAVFKIVLSGFANGTCSACSVVNGTWYLDDTNSFGGDCFGTLGSLCCEWDAPLDSADACPAPDGEGYVNMRLFAYSSFLELRVYVANSGASGGFEVVKFQKNFGTPFEVPCLTLVNEDIPLLSVPTDGKCSYVGSLTATVSTV